MSVLSPVLEHRYGTVIFLDLLGTKSIIQNEAVANFVKRFDKFMSDQEAFISNMNNFMKATIKHPVIPELRMRAFSDTVIITFSIDSAKRDQIPNDPILSRAAMSLPFFLVYGFIERLYFRGSISIGEFFDSPRLLMGTAIYEAAEYYDKTQWVGISATPSVKVVLNKNKISKIGNANAYFSEWRLPLKDRIEEDAWVISWPKLEHYQEVAGFAEIARKAFDRIRERIEIELESSDSSVASKWNNTRAFMDSFPPT